MGLKCRKEGVEHPILGWSYLPPCLTVVWKLGLLGRLSVQGETLSPYSPDSTTSGILVLSGSKFQLICLSSANSLLPSARAPGLSAHPPRQDPSTHLNLKSGARILALACRGSSHQT